MLQRILPLGLLPLAAVSWVACSASGPKQGPAEPERSARDAGPVLSGWLSWRGPEQHGTSPETGLFDTVTLEGRNHAWSYPISGRGTPVIADGRVFGLGCVGEGPDLQEVLFCLDERTGELLWDHRWADFLSDAVYTRYAIGAPTIDPETGNVFAMTGAGLLHGFTRDGAPLWEVSMMETLGRLTFPNGRVGAPVILGDLVIIHYIFASWGPLGPASDRFFAFDKRTGEVVWSSTPSETPVDGSFSTPILEERGGRTLLYAGLGGGKVVCVDAKTGDPVWRFPLANGGLNSSALIYGDLLIALNGKENLDTSISGRMVALDLNVAPGPDKLLVGAESWRNDLNAFTSSPVLVKNRVYATTFTGNLDCVDADTGEVLWSEKLGPDQLHASPLWADGKLYVPITNGTFWIIRPSDAGPQILDTEQLAGSCLGAPAVANGCVYVHTTDRLYCFGKYKGGAPAWPTPPKPTPGEPTRLRIVPADVTFHANGELVPFRVERTDAAGNVVDVVLASQVSLETPPFVSLTEDGKWRAARPGVGVVKATASGLTATARLRVVPQLPFVEDFSGFALDQDDGTWTWPPGHWLGGRMKWQVVEREGERVVTRRMDNPLFQRTFSLFGHPDDANYTVQADLMLDGNRRSMAWAGVINQRYLIVVKGNPDPDHSEIEVSSNMEHLKVTAPFVARANTWYTLKTRVDLQADDSAIVRAKVWPRGEREPEAWTIEASDPHGHTHGAAGVYGFTPQSRFTVYLDNLSVTPNE